MVLVLLLSAVLGQTSQYFAMTGDCDTQGDCVSSANYPDVHGNSESCSVTMLQDATVTVGSTFSLETCCDHLMIRGNDVEESKDIPTFLSAYETFSWSSDKDVTSEGWQLCFSDEHCFVMEKLCDNCDISGSEVSKGSGYTLSSCQNECLQDPSCLGIDFGKNGRLGECFFNTGQATSHGSNSDFDGWRKANTCASTTTPPGSGSDYFTFSGDCDVQGDCVSSNNYPSVHGNGESCYVTMLQDASVTPGGTFNLETCCDHLMIRGSDIESSYAVPFFLTAGETFIWTSDGSVSREGWQLCFSGDCDARGKTTSKYFSMSGDCDARGDCVSSSNYPNVHGHGDICTVTMLQDAAVIPGSTFEIETCCDHLMIRGVDTENPSTFHRHWLKEKDSLGRPTTMCHEKVGRFAFQKDQIKAPVDLALAPFTLP